MAKATIKKGSKDVRSKIPRAAKKPTKKPIKNERSLRCRNSLKLKTVFDNFETFFEDLSTKMEDFIKKSTHLEGNLNLPVSISSILKNHIRWRPKTDENDNSDGLGSSKQVNNVINFSYHTLEISLVDRTENTNTEKVGRGTMIKDFIYTGKSNIDPEGVGIFAAKTFKPDDKIGVYIGKVSDVAVKGRHIVKRHGKWIDANKDKLFLGTHLANDYTWGMKEKEKTKYNAKGGSHKINNAELRGVVLHATKIIQIHEEIAFDYQM